jgi:hypothetical protein
MVSWVAMGAPASIKSGGGGAALNGVVQIRPDSDDLATFAWVPSYKSQITGGLFLKGRFALSCPT